MTGPTHQQIRDVPCPDCDALALHPCVGRNGNRQNHHQARVDEATRRNTSTRERRPYDAEPNDVPLLHQEPEPPSPNERDGRVFHELTDTTRNIGLAGLAHARQALAQHRRHRPTGAS
jgi:hypothetical protein